MRWNKITKSFVTLAAVGAIAAGSLVTAGTAVAAPAGNSAVASESVAPLTVNNLGLTVEEAKHIQRGGAAWGYTGPIDGLLGTESWQSLQRFLAESWGYNDAIDGIAGAGTTAAFKRMAARCASHTSC